MLPGDQTWKKNYSVDHACPGQKFCNTNADARSDLFAVAELLLLIALLLLF